MMISNSCPAFNDIELKSSDTPNSLQIASLSMIFQKKRMLETGSNRTWENIFIPVAEVYDQTVHFVIIDDCRLSRVSAMALVCQ